MHYWSENVICMHSVIVNCNIKNWFTKDNVLCLVTIMWCRCCQYMNECKWNLTHRKAGPYCQVFYHYHQQTNRPTLIYESLMTTKHVQRHPLLSLINFNNLKEIIPQVVTDNIMGSIASVTFQCHQTSFFRLEINKAWLCVHV